MNEVKIKAQYETPHNTDTDYTHVTKHRAGVTLPPLPVGAMNRTLPLIPSRHAALLPAPPSSRHVVGVKARGVKRKRETGAEIHDHPPSPPVSITVSVVALAPGTAYTHTGAGIVVMAALRAVKLGGGGVL